MASPSPFSTPASRTAATPAFDSVPPPAPTPPPPGKWDHPRLLEIARRKREASFDEAKLRVTLASAALLALTFVLPRLLPLGALMSHLPTPPAGLLTAFTYAVHLARAALVLAALRAMRPLLGPTDDISDIPLTPRQRSLLGLRPVRESPSLSQPSTPGSAASSMPGSPAVGYVTPPRFVRASSAAGAFASAGASSRAATLGSSPPTPGRSPSSAGGGRSGAGSPAGFGPGGSLLRGPARNDFALSPIPSPNPLVRRAMAAKRWSLGGGGLGDSGAAPGSPSPAPTGGNGGSGSRTPSVTLSNKWLYQRQWSGNGPARHI